MMALEGRNAMSVTDHLCGKVAAQREAKAAAADRWAVIHGPTTAHGRSYLNAAYQWRDAARRALAGDLSPVMVAA